MTLTQTVTHITGKLVTQTEAKDFALNNFGLLATFIRDNKPTNYLKEEEKELVYELMNTKDSTTFDSKLAELYSLSSPQQQRNIEDAFPDTFQHYLKELRQKENEEKLNK